MQLSSLLILAISGLAMATVQKRQETPPPPGDVYVTARPACNITGFTEVPGNYTETIYQASNATLEECMLACRANSTCKSIAYAALYTECLWYNMYCNQIQLWEDDESVFDHFDEDCDICEYEGGA